MYQYCSQCNIEFLLNQGDPLAFQMFNDRGVFVFSIIVAIYFGLYEVSFVVFAGFVAVLLALVIRPTT